MRIIGQRLQESIHLYSSRQAAHPKFRFYTSVPDKVFGDDRDLIARRLIKNGGSKAFVLENLKDDRRRFTHDPLPLSNQTAVPEQPFVSNPLDAKIEKKVSIVGCGQVGLGEIIYKS